MLIIHLHQALKSTGYALDALGGAEQVDLIDWWDLRLKWLNHETNDNIL